MVQSIIDISDKEDKILNVVKAQHGLKNKSQAVALIAKIYADSFLESKLRPEYLENLNKIKKEGYGKTMNSLSELRKEIRS